jgi:CMP-N-acetylneuraminic acid synthetase
MIYYVIPARRGSKGLPFKNRTLVRIVLPTIPAELRPHTIVTTDDEDIAAWASAQGARVVARPPDLADDCASIKPVMDHAARSLGMHADDVVVMLYPTYPQRTWRDVGSALAMFMESGAPSLCCRKKVATHPYLTYYALPGGRGRKVVDHQLYRRQDYPECFEVSHYVCIFRVGSLAALDDRLLCEESIFYPIDDVIDVDTPEDWKAYGRTSDGAGRASAVSA